MTGNGNRVNFLKLHYSRFEVFLFKNCMHVVKTVQVGWVAIKTITSIHISSEKKVLKKCEIYRKFS